MTIIDKTDNKLTIPVGIGVVQTETIFDYLVSVEHNGYKYTFLSKNEDVFIEDVEEYLNGGYFNLFELNRKKAN